MGNVAKIVGLTLVLTCTSTFAADQTSATPNARSVPQSAVGTNADNSGLNTRDKAGSTETPQSQSNASSDRKLLAAVRHTVVRDKTLSTSAHNVKIMVAGAAVTLRGPVKSSDEKAKIESLVKQVQGVASIDNQLDVKTN